MFSVRILNKTKSPKHVRIILFTVLYIDFFCLITSVTEKAIIKLTLSLERLFFSLYSEKSIDTVLA